MGDKEEKDETQDAPKETTTEGEEDECCACCCSADGKAEKPLYTPEQIKEMKEMNESHPVLDRPNRRDCGCWVFNSDWPSLLVFLAAVAAVIVLWVFAFYKGQVDIALYGMAWNGNVCGQDGAGQYQVWINPTMSSSVFASSVCMPSCPAINTSANAVFNATSSIDTLSSSIAVMTSGTAKTNAEAALATMETGTSELTTQNTYYGAMLGDKKYEIDTSSVFCLCNWQKSTLSNEFFTYNDATSGVNVTALCTASTAAKNGYVELAYSSIPSADMDKFLGSEKSVTTDGSAVMDDVPCAYKYRTEEVFTRCSPWVSGSTLGLITNVAGASAMGDAVSSGFNTFSQHVVSWSNDLDKGKYILISCSALALVASITLIYFMSCSCGKDKETEEIMCACLEYVVWGTLWGLLVAFLAVCGVCAYQFKYYYDLTEQTPQPSTYSEDEISMYVYGVSMTLAALAFIIQAVVMCVCNDAIEKSIKIMISASEVFQEAWGLLLYPLFHNLALFIAIICWVVGAVFISTAGTLSEGTDGVTTMTYDENYQYALIYYVFMIIWIVEFMGAVGFMIVTGAILISFFNNFNKQKVANVDGGAVSAETAENVHKGSPVMDSFGLVLSNHMGTAAIGSFLIAVVVVIRWVLTYLTQKAAEKSNNDCAKYIASCIACLLQCFEDCMRYMVRSAYILTVLEGRWFFSAVCGGMWTIWSNLTLIAIANYISYVILWMCKLCVPLFCTAIGFVMLKSGKFGCTESDLSSSFVLLIPITLVSCVFSFTFMGLLDTSIEVIMMTFCKLKEMDEEYPGMLIMKKIPGYVAKLSDGFKEDLKKADESKKEGEMDVTAVDTSSGETTGLISGKEKSSAENQV